METKRFDSSLGKNSSLSENSSAEFTHGSPKHSLIDDLSFDRFQNNTLLTPRAIFSPLHYEAGYEYPLLIWLHGPGDDERQLRKIMPEVSMRNYVAVAPRGTREMAGQDALGYTWAQTEREVFETADAIFDCIEFVRERFNVAPTKVFIGGYQTGGIMALRQAFICPNIYAGVISVGAGFPQNLQPLSQIKRLRNLPILLSSGRQSKSYPESHLCDDLKLAHSAGMNVDIRQYPAGDAICTEMLKDMDRWMMDLACNPSKV